ncbi:ABC transporter permease [Alloacidobacterium dinghuense]|uniref:ABC transporter permease n=1 Tax=Alloacidobacterium dinghuense TaxID=2763107 RepID=A0A7G8BGU6_9BACT|nr:ABC transporter permease [Alloacidobacterium dinghuense]QNI31766.1 ABC transporter permease [Alloacidobacterium dinghuense]
MSIFLQDVRFALRQLWKHPGFALTAILSLALGIAATVSVFSVVYSVLIHPSPYAHANRIVQFRVRDKSGSEDEIYVSRDHIADLRNAHAFEDLVQMDEEYLADTTVDIPQDVDVVYLSGNAFPFFGVPAYLGRTFLPSDAPPNQAPQPVVVLTYQYWQRRFNGNQSVIGQPLRLDNRNYTILGIMPARFTWWDADVYVPLDTTASTDSSIYITVMRLRPGVTRAQALSEVRPIFQQMIREHPNLWIEGLEINIQGVGDRISRSLGSTLYLLFAAVLLLLVIGCVNVSILLLARGTGRRHEFAVRAAVGGSGWRIVRQLLTESLILGLAGAALGVIATYRSTPFVVSLLPFQLFPRGLEIPVHVPVLAFSVALAILTSILFGLFPALQLANPEIREVMQATTQKAAGSVSSRRLHAFLIAGQIALAMVLLTASASAIESFRTVIHTDLGFDPHNVADFSIPVHKHAYPTWEARANYFTQLRDQVARTQGVTSASLAIVAPPRSTWDFPIEILGRNTFGTRLVDINLVDPQFFTILHIPLLRGRLWDESETQRGARLAVVNQEFVRRYFPNGDILGHSVRIPRLQGHPPGILAVEGSDSWLPVIGVVGDARNGGLDQPVKPEIYVPYSLYMVAWIQVLAQTQGDPLAMESAIRRQIAGINPEQQVSYPVQSITERIKQEPVWAREHLIAVLASVFSALALVLATVGLYSVVSYSVAQRTHEFGIRMALGALRRHILLNVLSTAGISVGTGLLVGLILSFGLSGLLSRWIGNTTSNPFLVLTVGLLLVVVALLACIVPAFRASLVQPMKALRTE